MPTIPLYQTPQAAPQGLPGVRQQAPQHLLAASTIGSRQTEEMGKSMLAAGAELAHIVTQQQIQTNEARAKEHDANVMGDIQGILYGTPDNPGSGYMNQKGKTAVDTWQTTVERINQIGTDRSQGLDNGAQQELVKTPTQMRIQSAIVQAAQHRAQQNDVYQQAAGETRIKVAQDGAAQSFNPVLDTATPNFDHDAPGGNTQYQQYLQTIRSEAEDLADRKGLIDPDLRGAVVKGAMEKAYIGVLSHLIDKKGGTPVDMAVAQKYFDAVKGELSAEQQDKVKAVLQVGAIKDKGLALALEVQGKTGDLAEQEKDLNARFKAGDINAEIHSIALQHLRADFSQRKTIESENQKQFLGNTWDAIRTGKLTSITQLSPSQLSFVKANNLGPQLDAMLKKSETGGVGNDFALFGDLMRQSAEDPAGFVKQDLSKYYGNLTDAHINHLITLQTGINRNDTKAMQATKVVHDAVQGAKANMLAAGINLNPKPNTDAAKQLESFQTSLYDAVIAAQQAKGDKPLTPDEARSITLGMLKDQALSGTGWFGTGFGETHMPVWKMTAEQKASNWAVPEADRKQITESLRKAGVAATEVNIQRAYKAKQGVQ